ncbi:MAG: hypothetical protein IID44_26465 [Planctomycetes bacterium]|nr:hypothetical protein [Planctomycetota bacterium]
MKYTVMWAKSAEDHLADLWLQAEDRESIRRASDELEEQVLPRSLLSSPGIYAWESETKGFFPQPL